MVCLRELRSLRGEAGDFESAGKLFRLAQSRFLEAGNHGNAIAVARRLASLVIEQYERDQVIERVTEAKKYLVAATEWVEQLWNQVDSIEWRYMISDQFSNIYAEIAWCQAVLREKPEEIAPSVARAKGREFATHTRELERSSQVSEHLGEYLDQLRVESRLAESARWRAAAEARPDTSLNEDMRQAQRRLQDVDLKRRILIPPSSRDEATAPLDAVRAFLDHHPAALIWDITVSRWGTVVLLMGGRDAENFAGVKVHVLPLKGATVLRWIRDWSQAHTSFRRLRGPQREEARIQWAASTDKLLAEMAQSVVKPCIDGLKEENIELIIAAGILAGLPLHAATVEEGRSLVESFDSVAYLPNIAALSVEQEIWAPPASALCVVSDLAKDLPSAARETEVVSRRLQRMGADVSVLAQVGKEVGLGVWKRSAPDGVDGVTILADAPTVERVASLLPESDHFFYSGHGVGRFGDSGLVLAGVDGSESRLTEHDLLSMRALSRRPLVVLSACETAMGGHGASELFDVASSFARFVVGSLWIVVDADAAKFTDELYQALAKGNSPSRAFGVAVRALKQHQSSTASGRTVRADHPIYWAPFMALRGQ
jgi:CHAT domain-containing protein